jgi:RNA polymerase-binding transcription factor DksA
MHMSSPVRSVDPADVTRRLRQRWEVLRGEIRDALLRADAEGFATIAGQVHETQDIVLAELLAEVSHADIVRDVEEIRDIEGALRRLASGTWGTCIACHGAIPDERLAAYPTAKRCRPCQQRHELVRAAQRG